MKLKAWRWRTAYVTTAQACIVHDMSAPIISSLQHATQKHFQNSNSRWGVHTINHKLRFALVTARFHTLYTEIKNAELEFSETNFGERDIYR